MRSSRALYSAILAAAVLWCSAFLAAPWLVGQGGAAAPVGHTLYRAFHPVCHQLDDRSFHIFGGAMAVCARCASIYLGFFAGALLFPIVPALQRVSPKILLVVALVPMLLDVGLGGLGLHAVTNITRSLTGAFFGMLIPMVVLPPALEGGRSLLAISPRTDQ
jgi:uncharacterized membrane protein